MNTLSTYESIPLFHDKASIKVYINRNGYNVSPHWHEHLELFYFLEGEGQYTCNGSTFSVKAGDLVVVNSTQIHALTVSSSPIVYGCVLFYPSFFWDISFDHSILIQNLISNDSYVQNQLKEILAEYSKKSFGYDKMLKGLGSSLLCYLMRKYPAKQGRFHTPATSQLQKEHLLFDYIAKHYREKLTTADLADFCHINESYFCRFFKKHFGRTPTEYLNEYRIEKAIELLRNTSKSITEIAIETGFEDISYF